MATIAGVSNFISPVISARPSGTQTRARFVCLNNEPWKKAVAGGRLRCRAAPDKLSEKVAESVKSAEEACAENPTSGECAAAWDEVEEVSAAASHARDKNKFDSGNDPLEKYCKDNPETDECRTYDN